MKVKFVVTVTFGPHEEQSRKSFAKEDGKYMIPYLKQKIRDAVEPYNTWQDNAIVTNSTVKRLTEEG